VILELGINRFIKNGGEEMKKILLVDDEQGF